MRDRDALRLVDGIIDACEAIKRDMPAARKRLRAWSADAYPSGNGSSSLGGGRHSDPVAAAVVGSEIVRGGQHRGWRDRDVYATQLAQLDTDLQAHLTELQDMATDVAEVLTNDPGDDADGCALCDAARLPVDEKGAAQHACSDDCRILHHRHPNGHQDVYSRKAPPAIRRVHACTPGRMALIVDGREMAITHFDPTRPRAGVIVDRLDPVENTVGPVIISHEADTPPDVDEGDTIVATFTVPAAVAIYDADITHPPGVRDNWPRCSFHHDFAKRYGVDACPAITLWHLDHLGSRVHATLLREHHPAEFARHHKART